MTTTPEAFVVGGTGLGVVPGLVDTGVGVEPPFGTGRGPPPPPQAVIRASPAMQKPAARGISERACSGDTEPR
uniref:Uncharacterized protein n=1 Tax=mine drainage metagenome TaxID=410659 RepID=E6PI60_9ZZZZ